MTTLTPPPIRRPDALDTIARLFVSYVLEEAAMSPKDDEDDGAYAEDDDNE